MHVFFFHHVIITLLIRKKNIKMFSTLFTFKYFEEYRYLTSLLFIDNFIKLIKFINKNILKYLNSQTVQKLSINTLIFPSKFLRKRVKFETLMAAASLWYLHLCISIFFFFGSLCSVWLLRKLRKMKENFVVIYACCFFKFSNISWVLHWSM